MLLYSEVKCHSSEVNKKHHLKIPNFLFQINILILMSHQNKTSRMSGSFEVLLRKEEQKQKVSYLIVCRNLTLSLISSGILLRICLSARAFSFRSWNSGSGRSIIYSDKIDT